MDKQEYINTLKNLNLRPNKVKIKERKDILLNEQDNMQDIHNKIKDFFKKNPNPNDEQIKSLAKKWGMEEDELEGHIYMVLTSYMKNAGDLNEGKVLKEIFIQSSEIEALGPGKEQDMQILRLSMIAELDASNLYEKFAKMTKNKDLQKVLLDISKEEKVHVGEFRSLLAKIDPEYTDSEDEGSNEVDDLI